MALEIFPRRRFIVEKGENGSWLPSLPRRKAYGGPWLDIVKQTPNFQRFTSYKAQNGEIKILERFLDWARLFGGLLPGFVQYFW